MPLYKCVKECGPDYPRGSVIDPDRLNTTPKRIEVLLENGYLVPHNEEVKRGPGRPRK